MAGVHFIPRVRWQRLGDQEIAREEFPWGLMLWGTADALVDAGLVQRELLPGQPGQNRFSCTIGERGTPGAISVMKRSARIFQLSLPFSEEERRRKRAEVEKSSANTAKTTERTERELASIPRTAQQYKNDCAEHLNRFIKVVRQVNLTRNKFSGFQLSESTLRKFDAAVDRLLDLILDGDTWFDSRLQDQVIASAKAGSSYPEPSPRASLRLVFSQPSCSSAG